MLRFPVPGRFLNPPIIVTLVALLLSAAPSPGVRGGAAGPLEDQVLASVKNILDGAAATGDFTAAHAALDRLFDSLIAHAPQQEATAFREVAFARRLVRQLGAVDESIRIDLLKYLRPSPNLARTLTFMVREDAEKPAEVYAMLDRLRRERGDSLETFAPVAAAICVVHDRPLQRRFNESKVSAPDPLALYDFFISNENRMFFGLREVPAELLIYVVDVTASIDELQWALARYAGDPLVGARFFDIQYDYNHYRTGEPKKCVLAGWNLPNILRYGGVCADQAYYATTVGKAIGVPTAYVRGRNADLSHAWVGFLQSDGRNVWWNFNAGRYEAYQGVEGWLVDPQTQDPAPASFISLLAAFGQREHEARWTVAAFTDAALRLIEVQQSKSPFAPPPLSALLGAPESRPHRRQTQEPRKPVTEDILALLEAGLTVCPGYARGWFAVRDLAAHGALSLEDKKRWAGVLDRLCGSRYPDFSLSILIPMIASVEDINEQDRLWESTFRTYQGRHDLAAEIRMSQAEMWEKAGEINRAGQCYLDVIDRYANAGPFAVAALYKAERLLLNSGRANQVLPLFQRTWSGIKRPEDMAGMFAVQSNWYRVGLMLADRLEKAGHDGQSQQVRTTIGVR